jgi:tRNA dimethylallyltransferase
MSPLLVIVGETASGKSALAMDLAEKFDGELVCADSWTVYRGFDIGTAKPTTEDRNQIPHHLLDVADPTKGFSAAVFQRLAKRAIVDIAGRGRLPILVGGTGLYIDSVLYDYSFLPESDPKFRSELNKMSLERLLMRADEFKLDLSGIDLRNKRRVIRLIENNGARPTKKEIRKDTLILGIQRSHDELRQRIIARLDDMITNGFINEVRRLGEIYGWDCEPMKAPNYRAFSQYVIGEISLEAAMERVVRNDLQLAKKQRTWFKRNPSIHWDSDRGYADDILTTFLNKTD